MEKILKGQSYTFEQLNRALFGTDLTELLGSKEEFEQYIAKRDESIFDKVDEALKGQDHDHDENCEPESCPDVKEM